MHPYCVWPPNRTNGPVPHPVPTSSAAKAQSFHAHPCNHKHHRPSCQTYSRYHSRCNVVYVSGPSKMQLVPTQWHPCRSAGCVITSTQATACMNPTSGATTRAHVHTPCSTCGACTAAGKTARRCKRNFSLDDGHACSRAKSRNASLQAAAPGSLLWFPSCCNDIKKV